MHLTWRDYFKFVITERRNQGPRGDEEDTDWN